MCSAESRHLVVVKPPVDDFVQDSGTVKKTSHDLQLHCSCYKCDALIAFMTPTFPLSLLFMPMYPEPREFGGQIGATFCYDQSERSWRSKKFTRCHAACCGHFKVSISSIVVAWCHLMFTVPLSSSNTSISIIWHRTRLNRCVRPRLVRQMFAFCASQGPMPPLRGYPVHRKAQDLL